MSLEQPRAAHAVRPPSYRLTLLPRPDLVGKRAFWPDGYRRAAVAGDAAAAVVSGLASLVLCSGGHPAALYAAVVPLVPAAWIGLLSLARGYDRDVLCWAGPERRRIVLAGAVLVALSSCVAFLFEAQVPRLFVVLATVGAVLGTLGLRAVLRRRLHRSRRSGRDLHRVFVVGHADLVASAVEAMDHHPEAGLVPIAACLPTDGRRVTPPTGVPLTADAEPVLAMVDDVAPDAVVLVSDLDLSGLAARHLADGLRDRGLPLLVAARTDVAAWLPNPRAVQSPRGMELVRPASPRPTPVAP